MVILTGILIDVGLNLLRGVHDLACLIVDDQLYLLMTTMGIDIGIARHRGVESHTRFYDAEAGYSDTFIFPLFTFIF